MAVDDHGLEALRKAANEITPGDKSNYYINTKGSLSFTGLGVAAITHVSLDAISWTLLPALSDRKSFSIQNIGTSTVLVNYSNEAPASEGFRVFENGNMDRVISNTTPVYARVESGTGTIVFEELK